MYFTKLTKFYDKIGIHLGIPVSYILWQSDKILKILWVFDCFLTHDDILGLKV